MASYTLGIDPSSKREKTVLACLHDGVILSYIQTGVDAFDGPEPPAAVIIECVERTRGNYPGRPNTPALLDLIVEEERLKAMYRDLCPVYCVPRRVILAQAGYSPRRDGPADQWVSRYLMYRGYCPRKFKEPGHYPKPQSWRGTPLNTPDRRDALMAALFNFRDVRNQEYLAKE